MANRREFSKKTQREALKRSGMTCEAIGAMYGLEPGTRCKTDLAYGVEFDHIVLDANSKDNSLENCAAVCIKCHRWKTANHDIPMAAKTVRMEDRAKGIKKPGKRKIPSAPPAKADKPRKPVVYRPCTFYRAQSHTGDA